MKDWKAEYDKLQGETKEVRRQLDYYRDREAERQRRADELRDKFKELLIEVLGR